MSSASHRDRHRICLKPSANKRSIMRDVLWDIEYALQLQLTPMNRWPLDDSTTNASLEFSMPFVHRTWFSTAILSNLLCYLVFSFYINLEIG